MNVDEIKPYTQYRCSCGKLGTWTGAWRSPHRRPLSVCECGEQSEVIDDGHRYRLTWEMGNLHDDGWHPVEKESDDGQAIRNQFGVLRDWAATGEERIRNVHLYRSTIAWEEVSG